MTESGSDAHGASESVDPDYTDLETPDPDRPDPVLVRPYVRGGDSPSIHREETWPEEASFPDPGAQPISATQEMPAAKRKRPRGRSLALRLTAFGAGLLVALGVGAYYLFAQGDSAGRGPAAILPELPDAPLTPEQSVAAARARASASLSPSASLPSSLPPSLASANASGSVAVSFSANPPAPSGGASSPAAATLAPPPSSDRTGNVEAASGRCLMLGGLLALTGDPVQVSGCSGVAYQSFTLKTDGTLRVAGKCASISSGGEVKAAACGTGSGSQWRSGPNGTLVNPATNGCLTDPGGTGETTTANACTGAANQKWTLP